MVITKYILCGNIVAKRTRHSAKTFHKGRGDHQRKEIEGGFIRREMQKEVIHGGQNPLTERTQNRAAQLFWVWKELHTGLKRQQSRTDSEEGRGQNMGVL